MHLALIIGIGLILMLAYTIISNHQSRKSRFRLMLARFGKPVHMADFEADSIRKYAHCMQNNPNRIDDITWNDLDMDEVYKTINNCISSVGEEYLYNLLHEINLSSDKLTKREALIAYFEANPQALLAAQKGLFDLGKQNHNGAITYITDVDERLLPFPFLYDFFASLPLIGAGILIVNMPVGAITIVVAFLINLIIHLRLTTRIEVDVPAIQYISGMVQCSSKLAKAIANCGLSIESDLNHAHKTFGQIAGKTPLSAHATNSDTILIYLNIMFLMQIRSYNRSVNLFCKSKEALHNMYATIGDVDTAISIISYRRSLQRNKANGTASVCKPEFTTQNSLSFTGIYHPLIRNPVTNSATLDANCLITGSNASGKSSFIKALAINGILAQTINTCTAASFTLRHGIIISSMAMRDNILGGESYFMVEIRSIKRILDLAKTTPCTCFIDEILRGTNTAERVAASAAVLTQLNAQNCLCVVATHDAELAQMLPYRNYHFTEEVAGDDVLFDYTLRDGIATSRNAIKLLAVYGFDKELVEMAEGLAKQH